MIKICYCCVFASQITLALIRLSNFLKHFIMSQKAHVVRHLSRYRLHGGDDILSNKCAIRSMVNCAKQELIPRFVTQ